MSDTVKYTNPNRRIIRRCRMVGPLNIKAPYIVPTQTGYWMAVVYESSLGESFQVSIADRIPHLGLLYKLVDEHLDQVEIEAHKNYQRGTNTSGNKIGKGLQTIRKNNGAKNRRPTDVRNNPTSPEIATEVGRLLLQTLYELGTSGR